MQHTVIILIRQRAVAIAHANPIILPFVVRKS